MTLEDERGVALIVAMLAAASVAMVAATLALDTSTESVIAADYLRVQQARYGAEAALERAIVDVASAGDWSAIAAGLGSSTFTDGLSSGLRTLPDGATLDLATVVNVANCGKPTLCSSSDVAGNTSGQRPWGANNPLWHLFAYAPLTGLLPSGAIQSPLYVTVLIAGDPSGTGGVSLRAESFGGRGVHQIVEAIVEPPAMPGTGVRTRAQLMTGLR